ncbi:MAG TPA: tetratricopeptide repeat protein [Candidatus Sulfotelmatobacter sp.]|nr:tetratricopeptide repeat protein [Candidatus Sulfotelmatobacter sp.]
MKFRDANAKASLAEFTAGARYRRPSAFDLKIVALDYVLLGDYVDADKWLTRSLQWNPKDPEGWYYLGRAKYNENRFAEAVTAFQQCLKLDRKNAKAEDNLGLSYAGLGRNEDAIAAYETAIAWQSESPTKDPEPFIDLGSLYLDLNRPERAIPFLLQSVRISSQVPRAHEQLGRAYLLVNQLPQAQAELEAAVKLSPQTARLHYILGQIYRKEGQTAKAKVEFDRCIALQRSHPTDSSTM